MKKEYLLILISMILFMSFVSAVPPVQTTIQPTGLTLAYPQYNYLKQNSNFTLYVHIQNQTNLLTGSTASCWLDLYNSTGQETMRSRLLEGTADYYIPIVNNFTDLGMHSFVIQCNTSSQTGLANGIFQVTINGIENVPETMNISAGLFLLIFGVSIFFLILFLKTDTPSMKLFFFLLSFVFLIASLLMAMVVVLNSGLPRAITSTINYMFYAVGLIFFIIFALVLIDQIINALNMMRQKKGYETD